MVVSGNMATVTTKYSQPMGKPYGFVAEPEFKFNWLVIESEVRLSAWSPPPARPEGGGMGITVRRSIWTICPTM